MGKRTITTTLFKVGEPNLNNMIYSEEMAEAVLKAGKDVMHGMLGSIGDNGGAVNLSKVTHVVDKIYREGDDVKAEIEILNHQNADTLQKLYDAGLVEFKPEGIGEINESREMINYKMLGVSAIKKSDREDNERDN